MSHFCSILKHAVQVQIFTIFLSILSFGFSPPSYAGGPFTIAPDGTPSKWNGTVNLHPEGGSCGTTQTHAVMVQKLNNFATDWEEVTGVVLAMTVVDGAIPEDLTVNNYTDYWVSGAGDPGLSDNLNPIVFDANGAIVNQLFGSSTAQYVVLGAATPSGYLDDGTFHTITDGEFVINCRCQSGSGFTCPNSIVFSDDDLNFTIIHETGHLLNVDHTESNQDVAEQIPSGVNGDTYCTANPTVDCDEIPTMYPASVAPSRQATLARDDEVAILSLYGSSTWQNTLFSISGILVDNNGNAVRCADVQATTSDPADTVTTISGILAPAVDNNGDDDTADSGECLSNCGDFLLQGLDPAKTYTITVKPIDSDDWGRTAGSTIAPCNLDLPRGIVEEVIDSSVNSSGGETVPMGTVTLTGSSVTGGGIDNGDGDGDGGGGTSSSGCALNGEGQSGAVGWLFVVLLTIGMVLLNAKFKMQNEKP